MKKKMSKLGKILTKTQQSQIFAGNFPVSEEEAGTCVGMECIYGENMCCPNTVCTRITGIRDKKYKNSDGTTTIVYYNYSTSVCM